MIVKFKDMWYKSSTAKNTLNPDWHEDVTFPVYGQDLSQPVEFLLWDEDQGTRDDFMVGSGACGRGEFLFHCLFFLCFVCCL
jgi:hypothetical protein